MPGAQKMSWQHATSENPQQGIQINTNGQRFGSNNFMIDGADNNDPVLGIIVVNPAIDSVSEFKYTTGNYDAEYAQAGGAVLQIETKTGTNEFHGSLFEFLQNNITNARNPFSEPNGPPPLRWNQFGGSFGGPIKKNKLFVFGDYQGTRRRTGGSGVTTVPTAAERNGDFSALGRTDLRSEHRQLGRKRPHPVPQQPDPSQPACDASQEPGRALAVYRILALLERITTISSRPVPRRSTAISSTSGSITT